MKKVISILVAIGTLIGLLVGFYLLETSKPTGTVVPPIKIDVGKKYIRDFCLQGCDDPFCNKRRDTILILDTLNGYIKYKVLHIDYFLSSKKEYVNKVLVEIDGQSK